MRRRWWLLLVCVPVGLMAGLLASFVLMYLSPKIFESTAIVEIKPSAVVSLPDAEDSSAEVDPMFLEKEMAHLTSPEVMRRAVEKGAFDKRWGMTGEVAVEEMERSVRVERIQSTDLVSIRTLSVFRQDAPEMAEAVVDGYRRDRRERETKQTEHALDRLKQAVKDQEAQVEERRKKLSEIVRNKDLLHRERTPTGATDETKQEFDEGMEKLQAAKLELVTEKVSASMVDQTLIMHEKPQLPMKSEGPSTMKYLLFGMAGGLGAGGLVGLSLVLLFPKRIPSN